MFEMTGNFTQVPNAVLTHYRYFPKFDGNVVAAYAYLLKNYNAKYGYAFPTQPQASLALNTTDKTFSKCVKVLVAAGLIEQPTKQAPYWNYVYRFIKPIEDEAAFFAMYPEAKEAYDKRAEQIAKMAPKRAADKAALAAKYVTPEVIEDDFEW